MGIYSIFSFLNSIRHLTSVFGVLKEYQYREQIASIRDLDSDNMGHKIEIFSFMRIHVNSSNYGTEIRLHVIQRL